MEIHIKTAHRSRPSLVKLHQTQLVEQFQKLRCLSSSCNHQTKQSLKELKSHLNEHFAKKETVACLFSGCKFEANTAGTLRSHFSRKHKIQEIDYLKPEVLEKRFSVDDENFDLDNCENQCKGDIISGGSWR